MRNISFSLTTRQIKQRSKDITRRLGWLNLKPGEHLQGCEKCMGRIHGEPLVKLAVIEVVSAIRERLDAIVTDASRHDDPRREGFSEMTTSQFVEFFCRSHKRCKPETIITRIEFRYIDEPHCARCGEKLKGVTMWTATLCGLCADDDLNK